MSYQKGNPLCYLIIPPLVKYAAGPLLGPAILEGAAHSAGLNVRTLDLNIRYLRKNGLEFGEKKCEFLGDHSKPGKELDDITKIYIEEIRKALPPIERKLTDEDVLNIYLRHDEVYDTVRNLMNSSLSRFFEEHLFPLPPPSLLGVSVMCSAQVIPALLISHMARSRWPDVKIVWGGPHVTALKHEIMKADGYGQLIDGFFFGHSTGSFVDLLKSMKYGKFDAPSLAIPGKGAPISLSRSCWPFPPTPVFRDLELYGSPRLVLPVQLSRGCSYARCSYCTYREIEEKYVPGNVDILKPVMELAVEQNASVSIKDSLVLPHRLREIAGYITGTVPWSACTKLDNRLTKELMQYLARNGLKTIEVGLETLIPKTQQMIGKIQSMELLTNLLKNLESTSISLIVNYMTGFPGEPYSEAYETLLETKELIENWNGVNVKIEHNTLQVQRLSHMARHPEEYEMNITGDWPWASVLEWTEISEKQHRR